jgi:outer membrane protein assembly factor BamA
MLRRSQPLPSRCDYKTRLAARNSSRVSTVQIPMTKLPPTYITLIGVLLFALLMPTASLAQNSVSSPEADSVDLPVISAIAFIGNKDTKPDVILREMVLRKGDRISEEALAECKSRIYNMGLFNSVEISYPPMDSTVLLVEVTERWFLWPVPLVGIVDRDFSHWYYGAGLQHWNLRGRNEKLFVGGVLGYNPWASAFYSNPWIFDEAEMFTSTEVKFQRFENKNTIARGSVPEFDEDHVSVNQMLGKRIDSYKSVWTQFGFRYISVSDPSTGLTAASDGIDRTFYIGIGASHDTRDYKDYPMSGMSAGAAVTKRGLGISDVDYVSSSVDVRIYKPVFAGTSIAMRAFTRVVSGPVIPEYDNVFFGFGERIRGHFKERFEGQNIAGASIEYRIPILSPKQVFFGFIPINQFQNWRFGMYAAAFADGGTIWNKNGRPGIANEPFGYGAGLHFLLPYGFVFRLEYAYNELGDGQFIYDMRASF